MKKYTFAIDGHNDTYYSVYDIDKYFRRAIYQEDVRQTISYVKAEIRMREIIFKNNEMKRRKKVAEMEHVLKILSRCSDKFPEIQKELFD